MSNRDIEGENIEATGATVTAADSSSESRVIDSSVEFPNISEAKRKYDGMAASHEARSCAFERWKKEKDVQKQKEEDSIERSFAHLSPESRRRSISLHRATKNAEIQLDVERRYWNNAVGSITFEDPNRGSKTVIIPGVKAKVGPQVAFLSKTLDLKTPEQLKQLEESNSEPAEGSSESESDEEEAEDTQDSSDDLSSD